MIVDISLVLLLFGTLIERVYAQRQYGAERARLVNAVVARHAGELAALNVAPKPKPKPGGHKPPREPNEDEMVGMAGN